MTEPTKAVPAMPRPHGQAAARVLLVIPTLGRRVDLLRQSLESIRDKVPHRAEIVIVCPPEPAATTNVAADCCAEVVDDPGGMTAAINAGLATAHPGHEYFNWIGDDDLLTPGSLAATVTALDADPAAVVAYGYCDYI